MVLYGTEPQPVFAQNPVRFFDFVNIVVGDADHGRILFALEENGEISDPARRIDRIVHPVDVHGIDAEQAALLLPHILHGRI